MGKVILSLDGGGIRGAATTAFLSRLDEALWNEHGKTIRDCVDLFAGTSTGSIIALGLARTELSMERIDALYSVENAQRIFAENGGLFELDGVSAPKYTAEGKTLVLKEALGEDTTIGRGENGKHVLVVAYAIEKRIPLVVKSTDPRHEDLLAYRVADASSAAPTYFPTADVTMRRAGSERTRACACVHRVHPCGARVRQCAGRARRCAGPCRCADLGSWCQAPRRLPARRR